MILLRLWLSLPVRGYAQPWPLRGVEALSIDNGHVGDVRLDGLRIALLYAWPGSIFEGGGELQAVVDDRAAGDQRNALERVLHGEETAEAATRSWVFEAMSDLVHPTLFRPTDLDLDIDARRTLLSIPDVLTGDGRSIRPPHSDGEHRVRDQIPCGIKFKSAEIGSANSRSGADSAVALDLSDSYGQFDRLHHSGQGVLHA